MNCQCNKLVTEKKIGSIACTSTGRLIDDKTLVACPCEEDQIVEIIGVTDGDDLEVLETGEEWTQIFIPEILCIPSQKPNVEQILTIKSRVDIISQRVIATPKAIDPTGPTLIENYEGTTLTGRKLIIEGILRQKVIYTAAVEKQSIHSAHFDVPFSAFIVLEPDADPPAPPRIVNRYKIEPFIEDIFICRVSSRQIFKNVTIFIKATPIVCP